MIYTITQNPSIDYFVTTQNLCLGQTNRAKSELFSIGGKGLNVSIVLNNLNIKSNALFFSAGFTGDFIKTELKKYPNINIFDFEIAGANRINIKISDTQETEINGIGPHVDAETKQQFFKALEQTKHDDLIVISGSNINGMTHAEIINFLENQPTHKNEIILDIANNEIFNYLKLNPLLLKPNIDELSALFNVSIKTEADIIKYGRKLIDLGAKNVLISQGSEGSYFIDAQNVFNSQVVKGDFINAVGAGDSMVAGFLYAHTNKFSKQAIYKYACAAGTATAYSDGLAKAEMIQEIYEKISIRTII